MVRLSVLLRVPSGQARAIEKALKTLMRATRLESGCLGCLVWTISAEEATPKTDMHYEERWATEQAMENRVRSEAFTKVLEILEAGTETPQVEFDFVSRHQGLEYVEAVRRARS